MNFNGVNFKGLNDIAFKTKDFDIIQRTQTELLEEEQNKTEILDFGLSTGVKVVFEDPLSKNLVSFNLTEQNFKALKDKFHQSNDFYQRQDGSIRLNGSAENFVASWFHSFAYELNFLSADSNKNKIISGNETSNAYVNVFLITIGLNSVKFDTLGKETYPLNEFSLSIEEGVNTRLEQDKNSDKKVLFSEIFSQDELENLANIAKDEDFVVTKPKKKKQKDLLQKVLLQGLNSLNQKELAEFKLKFPKEYENLKQDQMKQEFSKDFLGQFLNNDFKILDLKI